MSNPSSTTCNCWVEALGCHSLHTEIDQICLRSCTYSTHRDCRRSSDHPRLPFALGFSCSVRIVEVIDNLPRILGFTEAHVIPPYSPWGLVGGCRCRVEIRSMPRTMDDTSHSQPAERPAFKPQLSPAIGPRCPPQKSPPNSHLQPHQLHFWDSCALVPCPNTRQDNTSFTSLRQGQIIRRSNAHLSPRVPQLFRLCCTVLFEVDVLESWQPSAGRLPDCHCGQRHWIQHNHWLHQPPPPPGLR